MSSEEGPGDGPLWRHLEDGLGVYGGEGAEGRENGGREADFMSYEADTAIFFPLCEVPHLNYYFQTSAPSLWLTGLPMETKTLTEFNAILIYDPSPPCPLVGCFI